MNSIFDAEYVLFAKRCMTCMGNGHIPLASCANPEGLNSSFATPSTRCPRCVNGFILQTVSPGDFMKQVATYVVAEMTGALRGQWYDLVVAELEQRIKDVELKIMGQQQDGPFKNGDRVITKRPLAFPGELSFEKGASGLVMAIRSYAPGNAVADVLFGSHTAPVQVDISDLEKFFP